MDDYTISIDCPIENAKEVQDLWVSNLESGCISYASRKLNNAYAINPVKKGIMIQIRDKFSQSVGTIGLLPRRFYFENNEKLAVALADFTVDSKHRSAGPALMLKRAALKQSRDHFSFALGLPNIHARAISRRAGMCSLDIMHRYTLVLKSKPKLSRYVKPVLVPFVAPVVDIALAVRGNWKLRNTNSGLVCRTSTFDDTAIDKIWAQRPGSLLISDRSAQVLKWRYSWTPNKQWHVTLVEYTDGGALGYVVWRIENQLITVSDFFCVEPTKNTDSLFAAFIRSTRVERPAGITINFAGSSQVINAFLSIGFFCSETDGDPVYVAKNSQIRDIPITQWYLTDYDNDD